MMGKKNIWVWMCVAAICAMCCGCGKKGGTLVIGSAESQTENHAKESEPPASADSAAGQAFSGPVETPGNTEIRVYVCGAVANPGVVEILAGSRAEDALFAAGGFAEDADREAVNLADWVSDGQKLYFPVEGEVVEPSAQSLAGAVAGLVNINTADAAALCTLPGVGESRAADIIAYRESNGGFASSEDIMKVPGIKTAMYEKIKDKITVK